MANRDRDPEEYMMAERKRHFLELMGVDYTFYNIESDVLRSVNITRTTTEEEARRLYQEISKTACRTSIADDGAAVQINHLLNLTGINVLEWKTLKEISTLHLGPELLVKASKMVQACKYQGFDPADMMKRVIKLWKDYNQRPGAPKIYNISLDGEGAEAWSYSDKAPLIEDVSFLVSIFLNRGAVVGKIMKKSNKEFMEVMKMLCGKYTIKTEERLTGRRTEALPPEVVTLPRIAATFPAVACELYHQGLGRQLVGSDVFPENLPRVYYSPMFSSVVSRSAKVGEVKQNLHPQLMLIAILLDNLIHQRDRTTTLDMIWTYHLASYNSKIISEATRHLNNET